MKNITLLVTSIALLGCSNSAPSKPLPAKKTFVKKETNTAPSNRNSHYPPVGAYYPSALQYQQNNNSIYNGESYVEPLGNGPLTHQNSAEDIENQRQGKD